MQSSDPFQSLNLLSMAISSNTSLTAVIYLLSQIVSAISVSTVVETQSENTSSTSFLYNQTQVCSFSLTLTLHLVYYMFFLLLFLDCAKHSGFECKTICK